MEIGSFRIRFANILPLILTLLSVGFVVWGIISPVGDESPVFSFIPFPKISTELSGIQGAGFAENATYPTVSLAPVPDGVKVYGSYLKTDDSTGQAASPWYVPAKQFYLFTAGYPNTVGNVLKMEARLKDGSLQVQVVRLDDAGDAWIYQPVSLQNAEDIEQFRFVAIDGAKGNKGWFGLSEPLQLETDWLATLIQSLRLFLAAVTAFTLVLAPGLVLKAVLCHCSGREMPVILVPLPGLAILIAIGLIAWFSHPFASLQTIAILVVLPCLLICLYCFLRYPISTFTTHLERRAILICFLVILIAIAKGSYALGPSGELYRGTISRTLEVGGRSDSRIQFHVVQLVAHGTPPHSDLGASYFAPWSFSHRGPLAGLAASPIVGLSGAKVPTTMPDQPWSVFDPEGFSAYRVAVSVFSGISLLFLFGLAKRVVGEPWALMALLIAATTPFLLHEVYFTWAKLQAGMLVLLAAYLILERRFLAAGFATGFGYLFHPLALLSVPTLLGVLGMDFFASLNCKKRLQWGVRTLLTLTGRSLIFLFGVVCLYLVWKYANYGHYQQSGFLNYLFEANGKTAESFEQWVSARLTSLFNTLIPLHLYLNRFAQPSLNSIYEPSPDVIKFFFQYWNTVPFGLGIFCFFHLLRIMAIGARKQLPLFFLVIVLPFILFWIYWGSNSTGLMPEGLHIWVFSIILLTVIFCKNSHLNSRFWKQFNVLLAGRGIEILAMLFLPVWLSVFKLVDRRFLLSDVVMISIMIVGVLLLSLQTYHCGEELRLKGDRIGDGSYR